MRVVGNIVWLTIVGAPGAPADLKPSGRAHTPAPGRT